MGMSEQVNQVSVFQLAGEPYQQTIEQNGNKVRIDCNVSLDTLAHNAGYEASVPERIETAAEHLGPLFEGGGYYGIDSRLKHGEPLSFDESFSLIAFVCAGLNRPLGAHLRDRIQNVGPEDTHLFQAVALLSSMSTKESYDHLTADEIAGVVAATIHLDTVDRTYSPEGVIAFGGMGGDKGYPIGDRGSKLFSLSTLSAVALSAEGPTHKHHSYPNTSKVAGQSAIEAVGARSDFHSPEAFSGVLKESGLLMSSCHNTRTLHTLSHKLKGETINHVIGPLAFTMSAETPMHGFIGVNEKVHPETVIQALEILSDKGYQAYDNSAVYCGTDLHVVRPDMLDPNKYYDSPEAKMHVRLDEIAPPPYASLVAFSIGGKSAGTYAVHPEDFYPTHALQKVGFDKLLIPNTAPAILQTNMEAIMGQDEAKSMYLAMTIGLGIFVRRYLNLPGALNAEDRRVNPYYLRAATQEALEILYSGQAGEKLHQYVETTQKYAGDQ